MLLYNISWESILKRSIVGAPSVFHQRTESETFPVKDKLAPAKEVKIESEILASLSEDRTVRNT